MRYWEDDEEEEEEIRYSNILQEEDFEDDEDPPGGFEGLQRGSNLIEEEEYTGPLPWDPSESFFTYI
jgi:hypothetical protein